MGTDEMRYRRKFVILITLAMVVALAIIVPISVWLHNKDAARLENVFQNGYEAAMIDAPPTACPYYAGVNKETWTNGWMKAYKEKKSK